MNYQNGMRYNGYRIFLVCFLAIAAFAAIAVLAPSAEAQSSYYVGRGCSGCHGATPTTCNGCHEHGVNGRTGSPQSATVNKTTFAPGENVIVTLRGGRTSSATNGTGGWVRGILYRDNVEIARSAGTVAPGNIGPSGGSGLPITFTTAAPTTPGTYTYAAAWYGNTANNGAGFPGNHGEVRAPAITITVAAPAVTLSSIAISGAASVNESTTSQYTATATWSNATTTNVTSLATWSTNIGTISSGGLLSAPAVTGNRRRPSTQATPPAG